MNFVVYRYRNNIFLKSLEWKLTITEYEALLSKRINIFSHVDVIFKRSIVLDETTVQIRINFLQEWIFFF